MSIRRVTPALIALAAVACVDQGGSSESGRSLTKIDVETGRMLVSTVVNERTWQHRVYAANGLVIWEEEARLLEPPDGSGEPVTAELHRYDHALSVRTIESDVRLASFDDYFGIGVFALKHAGKSKEELRGVFGYDKQGCDGPADLFECTNRGNCCDTHDTCFAQHGCSAWSWLITDQLYDFGRNDCRGCNARVAWCIQAGVGSNGGKSQCCAAGTCDSLHDGTICSYSPTQQTEVCINDSDGDGSGTLMPMGGGGGQCGSSCSSSVECMGNQSCNNGQCCGDDTTYGSGSNFGDEYCKRCAQKPSLCLNATHEFCCYHEYYGSGYDAFACIANGGNVGGGSSGGGGGGCNDCL